MQKSIRPFFFCDMHSVPDVYVVPSPWTLPFWPLCHPSQWVVFWQGWRHTQTLLWSRVYKVGFSLRSPLSQALNDSFIYVFKCSLCPFGAMSDAEEAWISKIGFVPSRNQSDVGTRNDLAARYRPDASLITPHSRNYCPNLQIRKKKNRVAPGHPMGNRAEI